MILKNGVKIAGLDTRMQEAIDVCDRIYKAHQYNLVITSALRPDDKKSKHSKGLAFDIRTRMYGPIERKQIHNKIASKLFEKYDVIMEEDHIHIEWEPKSTIGESK